MEGNGVNSVEGGGVTVVRSESPTDYHIAPRSDAASQIPVPAPAAAQAGFPAPVKKKRGRPRKYAADGSATKALSPKPISSSAPPPPVIDFSGEKQHFHVEKQPKPRSATGAVTKPHKPKFEVENLGDWVSSSVGANFTPHIITVNTGEDVMMKVISFSQQGPRAICILSANGVVSSATLRQPDTSGGTLTYEGRFEILSLTGSFAPSESGGIKNRSGGVSISLASPDGRVVGGGVAGLLVAAAPVQIVVASFVAVNEQEQKSKKQRADVSAAAVPMRSSGVQDQYGGNSKPAPSYFLGDNWSSRNNNNNNNNDHQD